MTYKSVCFVTLSLLAANFTACGSSSGGSGGGSGEPDAPAVPVTSAALTPKAQERIAATLVRFSETTADIGESDSGGMTFPSLTGCAGASEELDLSEAVSDVSGLLADVAEFLNDKVFAEEFVESESGDSVTYLVDPGSVCDGDAECEADLAAHPVRFETTLRSDDSVFAAIVVGEERVGSIHVSATRLAISADLAEILDLLQAIAGPDANDLPEQMSGIIEIEIDKENEQAFTMELAIREAVELRALADGHAVDVVLASATPAMSLRADSSAQQISFVQDWNELDVMVPGAVLCDEDSDCGAKEQNGMFHFHLAGLNGSVTATSGQNGQLSLSNLGYGDGTTFVNLDNETLYTLDINPENNRRFSLHLSDEGDSVLATFEPKLDMRMALMLGQLSDSLKMDLPDWLMDEVFDVTFGGAGRARVRIPKENCMEMLDFGAPEDTESTSEALEIVEGTLTLSSTTGGTVVVEAGMCLAAIETSAEEPHPFETVAAVICE
jgi:hypothetical protein